MTKADLHVHTTHSDGLLTPEEVVRLAHERGLMAIAITDHDILSGISIAKQAGQMQHVEIIPGVEISTLSDGQEIHILGYFIDIDHPELNDLLLKQRNSRNLRNKMIIDNLVAHGIAITEKEVQAQKSVEDQETNIGRPHIAEVLIAKGLAQTMDEAFEKYLGKNGLAYATPERISPVEAIRVIQEAGGVPVVAHPGLYEQDDLLPHLVDAGLKGIEVDHPDHTEEDRNKYLAFAEEYDLIVTAGSDYHGERNGIIHHADLATCTVPYIQVVKLKQLAAKI